MPNPASEPKKPVVQEEDIETLLKGFEAADAAKLEDAKAKARGEGRAVVGDQIEPTYEELLAEAEKSMDADIEADKAADEARGAAMSQNLGREGNILNQEAVAVAEKVLEDFLDSAKQMIDRPDDVRALLLAPIDERLRKVLDASLSHDQKIDERLRPLYARVHKETRAQAVEGMTKSLQSKRSAIERQLKDSEDSEKPEAALSLQEFDKLTAESDELQKLIDIIATTPETKG